jgi:hypothetical protein
MLTQAKDIIKHLFPSGKVEPKSQPVGGCIPFNGYSEAEAFVTHYCHYPVGVTFVLEGKAVKAIFYSRYQSVFVRHLTQSEAL